MSVSASVLLFEEGSAGRPGVVLNGMDDASASWTGGRLGEEEDDAVEDPEGRREEPPVTVLPSVMLNKP